MSSIPASGGSRSDADRASWVCGEVVNVDGGKLYRDNWF
jgi:hypothetical protein